MLEDYPRILPAREDLVILPVGQEFIMNQGVPKLVAWPISGNPLSHEEFSSQASALLLASWRPKTVKLQLLVFEMVSLVFTEG